MDQGAATQCRGSPLPSLVQAGKFLPHGRGGAPWQLETSLSPAIPRASSPPRFDFSSQALAQQEARVESARARDGPRPLRPARVKEECRRRETAPRGATSRPPVTICPPPGSLRRRRSARRETPRRHAAARILPPRERMRRPAHAGSLRRLRPRSRGADGKSPRLARRPDQMFRWPPTECGTGRSAPSASSATRYARRGPWCAEEVGAAGRAGEARRRNSGHGGASRRAATPWEARSSWNLPDSLADVIPERAARIQTQEWATPQRGIGINSDKQEGGVQRRP